MAKGGRKSNKKTGENDSIVTESQNPEGGNIGSSRDTMINRSNEILESPESIAPIVTPFVRNSEISSYNAIDSLINENESGVENIAKVVQGVEGEMRDDGEKEEDDISALDEENIHEANNFVRELKQLADDAIQRQADAEANLARILAEQAAIAASATAEVQKLKAEREASAEQLRQMQKADEARKRKRDAERSELGGTNPATPSSSAALNMGVTPVHNIEKLTFRENEKTFMHEGHVKGTAIPPMDRQQILEFEKKLMRFEERWPGVVNNPRQYFSREAEDFIATFMMSQMRDEDIFLRPWRELIVVLKEMYPESETSRDKAASDAYHATVAYLKSNMQSPAKWYFYHNDVALMLQKTALISACKDIMQLHGVARDDCAHLMKGQWGVDVVETFMKLLRSQNNSWDKELSAVLEEKKRAAERPADINIQWLQFHASVKIENFHNIKNTYEASMPRDNNAGKIQKKPWQEINAMNTDHLEVIQNTENNRFGYSNSQAEINAMNTRGSYDHGRGRNNYRRHSSSGNRGPSHYGQQNNNVWGVGDWDRNDTNKKTPRGRSPQRSPSPLSEGNRSRSPSSGGSGNRQHNSGTGYQQNSGHTGYKSQGHGQGYGNGGGNRYMPPPMRNNSGYQNNPQRNFQGGSRKFRLPACYACGKSHSGGPDGCEFLMQGHPDVNTDQSCNWKDCVTFKRLTSISDRVRSLEYGKKLQEVQPGIWGLVPTTQGPKPPVLGGQKVSEENFIVLNNTNADEIIDLYSLNSEYPNATRNAERKNHGNNYEKNSELKNSNFQKTTTIINNNEASVLLDSGCIGRDFITNDCVEKFKMIKYKLFFPIQVKSIHDVEKATHGVTLLNFVLNYEEQAIVIPVVNLIIVKNLPTDIVMGHETLKENEVYKNLDRYFGKSIHAVDNPAVRVSGHDPKPAGKGYKPTLLSLSTKVEIGKQKVHKKVHVSELLRYEGGGDPTLGLLPDGDLIMASGIKKFESGRTRKNGNSESGSTEPIRT